MKNSIFLLFLLLLALTINNYSQWQISSTGLRSESVSALCVRGNYLLAGTSGKGIYLSSNNGVNWVQVSPIIGVIKDIISKGDNFYAATLNGIYMSSDNGSTWVLTSPVDLNVYALAVKGNLIFAGTQNNNFEGNLYVSSDNGTSWEKTSLVNQNIYSVGTNSTRVYAAGFRLNIRSAQ
ncbi:MAG: hypothetical protein L0Y79_00650 [Chlorobi bacterium]|nr:hypothetical protein [Chlorobiota bacterium]MCI0715532.1 hypothetical protein [Chlorobiota bacterium]